MKKIAQYRYNLGEDIDNVTVEQLIDGSFLNNKIPIYDLSIQSLPGVKFTLNSGNIINIGYTGLFEIPFGEGEIISLKFNIETSEESFIIIDILYEDQESA